MTHLVARAGDRISLCGVKDPYPRVTIEAAPSHAYAHKRCVECYTAAGYGSMLSLFDSPVSEIRDVEHDKAKL